MRWRSVLPTRVEARFSSLPKDAGQLEPAAVQGAYVIDAGDTVLGPGLKGLLKRACAIGRRRADLKETTLKACEADL